MNILTSQIFYFSLPSDQQWETHIFQELEWSDFAQ